MRYLTDPATPVYDAAKCTGCGRCVEVCPHAVFTLAGKKAVAADRGACMECGACGRNCEGGAIVARSGVGCAEALMFALLNGGEPACGCGGDEGKSGGCC
jgi:NAD-dependent dihydropyrimidine dehydrogenase PreA subunit